MHLTSRPGFSSTTSESFYLLEVRRKKLQSSTVPAKDVVNTLKVVEATAQKNSRSKNSDRDSGILGSAVQEITTTSGFVESRHCHLVFATPPTQQFGEFQSGGPLKLQILRIGYSNYIGTMVELR